MMIPKEVKEFLIEISASRIFKILIVIIFLIIGFMSVLIFNLPSDNIIEQIAEEIIKIETGIDIDFSPDSGDK